MQIAYPGIILKKGRSTSLLRGHPWLFSGAIARIEGKPAAGDIALTRDFSGKPLALGFYNPQTDIAFRLLTRNCQEEINADFWRKRVQSAVALRSRIINRQTDAYRLINAEGDGFPGLIVDVYGRTLVISIATAGMEKQKKYILDVLLALTQAGRIYEQSEGRSRKLEGLENFRGLIFGNEQSGPATIRENGLQFEVDIPGGQKTGFFLDQRQNRETLGKISSGSRVLNCFCYTGAFSVYCAAGGAQQSVLWIFLKPLARLPAVIWLSIIFPALTTLFWKLMFLTICVRPENALI